MNLKKVMGAYKVFVGIAAWYTTSKLLEDKLADLTVEGESVTNAFLLGAGQRAISLAVGVFAVSSLDMI